MNLREAILKYLELNGDNIKGLIREINDGYTEVNKVAVTRRFDNSIESISFYNDDELIYDVDYEEFQDIEISPNVIKEIPFNHVIAFGEVTGYDYVLCIDMDFKGLIIS